MLRKQVTLFILFGLAGALADAGTYSFSLYLGLATAFSKALGFVFGTSVTYLLNKNYTFGDRSPHLRKLLAFMLLYLSTLGVNVVVNELALWSLQGSAEQLRYALSFIIATGLSSSANFLGLRFLIFRPDSQN